MTNKETDTIKEYLSYAPLTGKLVWIKRSSACIHVGDEAGAVNAYGYIVVRLKGKLYPAHRIAMLFIHGHLKSGLVIDHINRVKCDNRKVNLRFSTITDNAYNRNLTPGSTTGKIGVSFCSLYGKYVAYINVGKVRKSLGYRVNLTEAIRLRKAAEVKYYGREFDN